MTPKINDLGFDNLNSCCKPLFFPATVVINTIGFPQALQLKTIISHHLAKGQPPC